MDLTETQESVQKAHPTSWLRGPLVTSNLANERVPHRTGIFPRIIATFSKQYRLFSKDYSELFKGYRWSFKEHGGITNEHMMHF